MTNEELIKRYFLVGGDFGDVGSYGFYTRRVYDDYKTALFSRTTTMPMATNPNRSCFLIVPFDFEIEVALDYGNRNLASKIRPSAWQSHVEIVHKIAEGLRIEVVVSPQADKKNFHKYMERKINRNLRALARDIRTNEYKKVPRTTESNLLRSEISYAYEPEPTYTVPENYQRLMKNIHALLDGECLLNLPKYQVSLLDDSETQTLWSFLIKSNQHKKDQEILRKLYTMSRLLAPRKID